VVDLFRGQTPMHTNFTVSAYNGQIGLFDTENGIGNRLELDEEEILKNLQEVQLRNGLPQTKYLKAGEYDFDIEMETGTGKTYVYLRTIFELHKNYGFSKFIIVVPSIAIKEGVYKTLQITEEHFKELYDNTIYHYFIYDSSKEEIGKFPTRLPPENRYPAIDAKGEFPPIEEINRLIKKLTLCIYSPLAYVLPEKRAAYEDKYDMVVGSSKSIVRQIDSEQSLVGLIRGNNLK